MYYKAWTSWENIINIRLNPQQNDNEERHNAIHNTVQNESLPNPTSWTMRAEPHEMWH